MANTKIIPKRIYKYLKSWLKEDKKNKNILLTLSSKTELKHLDEEEIWTLFEEVTSLDNPRCAKDTFY